MKKTNHPARLSHCNHFGLNPHQPYWNDESSESTRSTWDVDESARSMTAGGGILSKIVMTRSHRCDCNVFIEIKSETRVVKRHNRCIPAFSFINSYDPLAFRWSREMNIHTQAEIIMKPRLLVNLCLDWDYSWILIFSRWKMVFDILDLCCRVDFKTDNTSIKMFQFTIISASVASVYALIT